MLDLIGHRFSTSFWSLADHHQRPGLPSAKRSLIPAQHQNINLSTMNRDTETHPYLAPGQVSSIESWTRSIPRRSSPPLTPISNTTNTTPTKTSPAKSIPSSIDETILAYLRLKLALLSRSARSWVLLPFAKLQLYYAIVFWEADYMPSTWVEAQMINMLMLTLSILERPMTRMDRCFCHTHFWLKSSAYRRLVQRHKLQHATRNSIITNSVTYE